MGPRAYEAELGEHSLAAAFVPLARWLGALDIRSAQQAEEGREALRELRAGLCELGSAIRDLRRDVNDIKAQVASASAPGNPLEDLRGDVAELRPDVSEMQASDLAKLHRNVGDLQALAGVTKGLGLSLASLRNDVTELRADINVIGTCWEHRDRSLKQNLGRARAMRAGATLASADFARRLARLTDSVLQKLVGEEIAMHAEMAETVDTDEERNILKSYIFNMRDKCAEGGEYGEFIASANRDSFMSQLTAAEDWLYDEASPIKAMYIEKLDELTEIGERVIWRYKESGIRDEWVSALLGTICNYKSAALDPGERYGHISPDKLSQIVKECDTVTKWLQECQAKQALMAKSERPVLLSADMEKRNEELAKFCDEILKEPKPKAPAKK